MLYNICTGIYKFGNNPYPRRIRLRSNLGHIFRGEKKCILWPGKYGISSQFPGCWCKWTCPIQSPNIPSTKSHVPLVLLRSYQSISPGSRFCLWTFRHRIRFNRAELLAPRPVPKLEYHSSSTVRECLFNIFAATLYIGGRSSIRNLRTRHVVVTGTHLSHGLRT